MHLDLDDTEQAALTELLRREIETTRYPMAPRLRPLRSVLAKLGVETRRPDVASLPPAPKPPGEPSMVVATRSGPPWLANQWTSQHLRLTIWCKYDKGFRAETVGKRWQKSQLASL